MKPEQYKEFLKKSLTKNPHRAIFVKGGVGIGKSECTKQVADELNFEFKDIRLSLLDATDLRGLPTIDKKETIWTKPIFLPSENYDKDLVLFFDEFNTANKSMQNACLQLMLDRCIGEYKLPEKTRVICAGNRLQDGGFVTMLSSAMNNRVIHITFEPDFDDWKKWAFKNNINPLIISFHNYRKGDLLNNYRNDLKDEPFATPRSWKYTDEVLKLGLDNGVLYEAIKGAIGEGAGTEFYGFLKIYRDLPEAEDILEKGKDIIPQESSIMYALCGALINYVRSNKNRIDRLIEYSIKIQKEFAVVLIKDLLKTELRNDVVGSKQFNKWVEINKEVII